METRLSKRIKQHIQCLATHSTCTWLLLPTEYVFLFRLPLLLTGGFIRSQRLLPPLFVEPLLSSVGAPVRGIASSNITDNTT